jgi:serine/threonine protein kinase
LVPNAPIEALDLMQKLFTYDPKKRLTALEVLHHPFFKDIYDPKDTQILVGDPVSYYDFEFEQYSLNKEIIQELLLDEIILANSKEARAINKQLRSLYPDGILDKIYDRQDQ